MSVCSAKTQISLGIRPFWLESSLCSQWVSKDPSFLHVDSKDWSDWAHTHFVGFVMLWLSYKLLSLSFIALVFIVFYDNIVLLVSVCMMENVCLSPFKRICVFEHSVMTNFNCPAIQRGQGSGFLSEGSSWLTACMSEQRRFWRDCANAQAHLNIRCSHMR